MTKQAAGKRTLQGMDEMISLALFLLFFTLSIPAEGGAFCPCEEGNFVDSASQYSCVNKK